MKANLVTPIQIDEMKAGHHPPTTRLSDNAFYLIVLASLLRKAFEPRSLQRFLVPVFDVNNDNTPGRVK